MYVHVCTRTRVVRVVRVYCTTSVACLLYKHNLYCLTVTVTYCNLNQQNEHQSKFNPPICFKVFFPGKQPPPNGPCNWLASIHFHALLHIGHISQGLGSPTLGNPFPILCRTYHHLAKDQDHHMLGCTANRCWSRHRYPARQRTGWHDQKTNRPRFDHSIYH